MQWEGYVSQDFMKSARFHMKSTGFHGVHDFYERPVARNGKAHVFYPEEHACVTIRQSTICLGVQIQAKSMYGQAGIFIAVLFIQECVVMQDMLL